MATFILLVIVGVLCGFAGNVFGYQNGQAAAWKAAQKVYKPETATAARKVPVVPAVSVIAPKAAPAKARVAKTTKTSKKRKSK